MDEAKDLLHAHRIEKLLVVDEGNRLKGLITMKDIDKVQKYPNSCKDDNGRLRVGAALGIGKDCEERPAPCSARVWTFWFLIPPTAIRATCCAP